MWVWLVAGLKMGHSDSQVVVAFWHSVHNVPVVLLIRNSCYTRGTVYSGTSGGGHYFSDSCNSGVVF